MHQFLDKPRIVSDPHTCSGKPFIAGTRIRVHDIYVWHVIRGKSPDQIVAEFPQLSLGDVFAALAYCFDHIDEIRKQLQEDETFAEAMKAKWGPGPFAQKVQSWQASNAAIPSR